MIMTAFNEESLTNGVLTSLDMDAFGYANSNFFVDFAPEDTGASILGSDAGKFQFVFQADPGGPQFKTTASSFNEGGVSSNILQSLVGGSAWDNSSAITYHLEFSDFNSNSVNDWDEDGSGAAMRLAFALWEAVADITLTEVAQSADANLVERVGDADGALGFHFFPNTSSVTTTSGGITLPPFTSIGEYNQDGRGWDTAGLAQGGYGFITLIHEIGHGLGLEHAHDDDLIPGALGQDDFGTNDLNQGVYTTMSYNDGWKLLGGGSASDGFGWQGTPMALDIAAIQTIYGANMNTATGNDTYSLTDANAAGTFFSAIWDAGGTDEISYTGASNAYVFLGEATIDQTATGGGLISFVEGITGGLTVAQNVVIENGTTGSGNDLLDGNDSDNILSGNAGNDALVGRLGADTLNGGAGNDLLIGDFDGLSSLLTIDASIGGGISSGTGTITAGQATSNASIATAIDISAEFSLAAHSDIENATTVPHVTVQGTGNGERDIFELVINNPFAKITVDVDNTSAGYDAFVGIADSSGTFLSFTDDSNPAEGAGGSVADNGNGQSLDSYLEFVPGVAGTYYIVVGSFPSLADIPAGATYDLNVSVENELGGASPYALFLDYFNFSATGGANDTLNGGTGDDTFFGGDGDDIINGDEGIDTAVYGLASTSDYTFVTNAGGTVTVTATSGNEGSDTLSGVEFVRIGGVDFDLTTLTSQFTEGDDNVTGTAGVDVFDALGGNDIVDGLGGDDTLNGGAGNDTLIGGTGNDALNGDADNDELNGGAGADSIDGGAGTDTLSFQQASSGVEVRLWSGVGIGGEADGDTYASIERVLGSEFDDYLQGKFGIGETLEGLGGNDRLEGNNGNDILLGGVGNDDLRGQGDNDQLFGGNGDDLLSGGLGADSIDGGGGTDTLSYQQAASGVEVRLWSRVGVGGEADGDTYNDVEHVLGSQFDDYLQGRFGFGETLEGLDGNDLLTGDNGNDILLGGFGDDDLRGQGDDDQLFGNNGDDLLNGGTGIDVLNGGNGNDVLIGGAGADVIDGGAGTDTLSYQQSSSGVEVRLWSGVGVGGEAEGDTYADIERVLGSQFDDYLQGRFGFGETLEGLGGNDLLTGDNGNDILLGGFGDDDLRGQGDDDQLFGGNGDDVLSGGLGADVIDGGAGTDTLSFQQASSGVEVRLWSGVGIGGEAEGDTYTDIERVLGSQFDDFLQGRFGFGETLEGLGGNDRLTGGNGNDTLLGGEDDDELNGGTGSDTFIFESGDGDDVIDDFDATDDSEKIDLSGVSEISDFSDLSTNHLTDSGSDAVISYGGNSITLTNVDVSDLDANDFIF